MTPTFNISGTNIEVTPALDQYAREKFRRLNVFKKVTTVHIILSIEDRRQNAEAKVNIAGDQKGIFAKVSTDDMYASLDELGHKVFTQAKKFHDISTDHHKGE